MVESDWKNAAIYASTVQLNRTQWAWEFLRRNATYRSGWLEFVHRKEAFEQLHGCINLLSRRQLNAIADAWELHPKCSVNTDCLPQRLLFPVAMARKWRLTTMFDPSSGPDDTPRFIVEQRPRIWYSSSGKEPPWEETQENCYAYLELDLSADLTPQLTRAAGRLKDMQRRLMEATVVVRRQKRNPQLTQFPRYIRVLDAYAAGAKKKNMASLLFPTKPNDYSDGFSGNKAVSELLAQARHWVDNYEALL